MNQLLAWMEDNQADGELAMEHFLTNYSDTWNSWVSTAVAARVQQGLAAL